MDTKTENETRRLMTVDHVVTLAMRYAAGEAEQRDGHHATARALLKGAEDVCAASNSVLTEATSELRKLAADERDPAWVQAHTAAADYIAGTHAALEWACTHGQVRKDAAGFYHDRC